MFPPESTPSRSVLHVSRAQENQERWQIFLKDFQAPLKKHGGPCRLPSSSFISTGQNSRSQTPSADKGNIKISVSKMFFVWDKAPILFLLGRMSLKDFSIKLQLKDNQAFMRQTLLVAYFFPNSNHLEYNEPKMSESNLRQIVLLLKGERNKHAAFSSRMGLGPAFIIMLKCNIQWAPTSWFDLRIILCYKSTARTL